MNLTLVEQITKKQLKSDILKKYKDHGTVFDKKHEDEREIITP